MTQGRQAPRRPRQSRGMEQKRAPALFRAPSECFDRRRQSRPVSCALQRQNQAKFSMAGTGFKLKQRSEEHTSELQSLMRISYAVFCLKKKKNNKLTKRTKKRLNSKQ